MNRTTTVAAYPLAVAVYGTLKRGHCNHHLLGQARLLGTDHLRDIVLYDLGDFPAAVPGHSAGVTVEVYEVSNRVLVQLDELEDCHPETPRTGLYHRQQMATRYGPAWIYLYNGDLHGYRPMATNFW